MTLKLLFFNFSSPIKLINYSSRTLTNNHHLRGCSCCREGGWICGDFAGEIARQTKAYIFNYNLCSVRCSNLKSKSRIFAASFHQNALFISILLRWIKNGEKFNAFKWLSKELFCFPNFSSSSTQNMICILPLLQFAASPCLHTFFWCYASFCRLFSMNCKMLIKFILMFINALVCLRTLVFM